ncbi:Pro-Pol polyprotein [Folsomia candida]|uniref:Pro-Pol polyprotein n=1 Tax=Folsomia candida TaxID=158441 RepID=A0A226E588_FOLCA|nr:Pro-Pol polyprotein [Folsomia candida]
MDRLKKARTPVRASITKTIDGAVAELAKDPKDTMELTIRLRKLQSLQTTIREHDEKVLTQMLDDNCTAEAYTEESAANEEYSDKISAAILKIEKVLDAEIRPLSPSPASSYTTANGERVRRNRTFKLPKIQLQKFSGDTKEWLGWWSQFRKIDEDDELHASDKFQYLLQSTVSGSRARGLVESFPMTTENYPKAVIALKERFGKEKFLQQVYVRELLRLVITTAKSKEVVVLSKLYDDIETQLRALESLGIKAEQSTQFLFPMVESCLPEEILLIWQRSPLRKQDGSQLNPKKNELDFLMEFLREEVEGEENRKLVRSGFDAAIKGKEKNKKKGQLEKNEEFPTAAGLYSGQQVEQCVFCGKSNHKSQKCFKAQKMPLEEKKILVKENKGCFICLGRGHIAKKCKASVSCRVCKSNHHEVMCSQVEKDDQQDNSYTFISTDAAQTNIQCQSDVLLKTVLVKVGCQEKKEDRVVRLLFDEGSQRSYITYSTAKAIRSKPMGSEFSRNVLFDGSVTDVGQVYKHHILLRSLYGRNQVKVVLREKPIIGGIVPRVQNGPWIQELKARGILLSDYSRHQVAEPDIQILIGSDLWGSIMTGRMIKLRCGLVACESVFGWSLSGPVPKFNSVLNESISMFTTEENVQEMWTLEALGIEDPIEVKSKLDQELIAKKHFAETVSRQADGRYSVGLPWIGEEKNIPNNRMVAENRLQSTTRRLLSTGKFDVYGNIFKSWKEEGIVEEVNVYHLDDLNCHYLPHHPVFKESVTTPVRPVFDASCKTKRYPSLNDCLHKGPNLMELIPSVLLRFREKKIGVVSDVRKAFQMIDVQESDRDYLRFLWWEDPAGKKIKIYRHCRVVFGVNCSPFLLAAVVDMHLSSIVDGRQEEALKLMGALYVDNCVTSVDSVDEYEAFKVTSTKIMEEAKIELRQWECSVVRVPGVCSPAMRGCGLGDGNTDTPQESRILPTTMVLGLIWDKYEDTLSCDIKMDNLPDKLTKRSVLSMVHKVYDPIGFSCPALIKPKMLLQKAWERKTGWDEPLPMEEAKEFKKWCEELPHLKSIHLPRFMKLESTRVLQMHVFCDASQDAYAAVVFLRSEVGDQVEISLLQAKARVAPLKKPTIPRLELMAALIGVRLCESVKSALNYETIPTTYWSDSTTVLAWIRGNDNWGTFVGNRVREICTYTDSKKWRHVPGLLNPADLPSRGCNARELLQSGWWMGPDWLKESEETWPHSDEVMDEEEINQEMKKSSSVDLAGTTAVEIIPDPRFSTYVKNVAVVGWQRHFVENTRVPKEDRIMKNYLTVQELREAEIVLLREIQASFVDKFQTGGGVKVQKMEDGLLHVKTRLLNRVDSQEFKMPILLPKSHPMVLQLIRDAHRNYCHAGVQFIMGKLREKYWILQARKTIRSVIHNCSTCRRFESKKVEVEEAALPEKRVAATEPFQTTGVDLAGPLYLKDGSKVWIVLFTCAVFRGIHVDLITSLSTEAFLESLERFIKQCGRPNTIYSDNGTNFVGASSRAWWGGWWERLIRSIKDLLKRMLGRARLTYDQLRTCLSSAAAVINSRPLTTVNEDKDDLIPLTPVMFMRGALTCNFPESMEIGSRELQSHYKRTRRLQQDLQAKFRKEYLGQLVQKANEKKARQLQVGDVVLVGADNKKRFDWPMGRIMELIPGKDGVCRVANVKTSKGTLKRPLQRLYPLEIASPKAAALPISRPSLDSKKKKQVQNKPEVNTIDEEIVTKSGRISKKPVRYSQWNL